MIPLNMVELHLAINHLPVLGLPFAAGLLFAGLFFENGEWRRAGLWTAVLSGIAVWLVYYSGGLAADAIDGLAGVSDQDVGRHAAAAWRFAWAASVVGFASAAVLARFRREPAPPARACTAMLALTLAATAVGGWTAHLGGHIRHPELHEAHEHAAAGSPRGGMNGLLAVGTRSVYAEADAGGGDGGPNLATGFALMGLILLMGALRLILLWRDPRS